VEKKDITVHGHKRIKPNSDVIINKYFLMELISAHLIIIHSVGVRQSFINKPSIHRRKQCPHMLLAAGCDPKFVSILFSEMARKYPMRFS